MRLLLDAHVSGPNVGRRLEQKDHDVRALDQEPALERLDDDEVLALATSEQRSTFSNHSSKKVVQANPMALEDGCWDLNGTRIYEPAPVRRDQLVPLR